MEKNEKRTYLSPETEVVRFTADIITSSTEVPTGENFPEIDIEPTQPT